MRTVTGPKKGDTLNEVDKQRYQAAIGCLIYLMLGSRPDLAFSVNKLAQYCAAPTVRHWIGVKRIIRFDKGTLNYGLLLRNVPREKEDLIPTGLINGYFDAAFMDDTRDRHSTMGYVFFCAGSLVSWSSRKQRTGA